jgi:capsular exopolysaccharide synthesis family protein
MDLRTFGRAIRRSWWVIVLLVVVGTGVSAYITSRIAPTYASKVTFFVATPGGGDTNALQAQQVAQLQVNSYVQLLSSEGLSKRLVGSPGLGDLTASQIESRITPSAPVNTVLVTATVKDTSTSRALALTRAIATEFPPLVESLSTSTKARTVLHVVSGPTLNHSPVSPHKTLNIGLGFLVGLALGLTLAFLRLLLDTSVRTAEQVEAATGVTVIGSIGYDKNARRQPIILESQARSVRAESFRQLRTNLQFTDVDHGVRVVVVTSSFANEGKSTVATNLAIVFAESGDRVLLIEADLRKPRVADYLGLERAVGLTNVLVGQVELDDVLQPWGSTNLTVLASGSIPPNPSELLGSDNMRELIATLRGRFDVIIFDSPPLLPVTDAAVTSALADGVVMVVRHGKTGASHLEQAARALRSVDARVLGVVLNMRKSGIKRRYDGYGYYEDAVAAPVPAVAESEDDLDDAAASATGDGDRREDRTANRPAERTPGGRPADPSGKGGRPNPTARTRQRNRSTNGRRPEEIEPADQNR